MKYKIDNKLFEKIDSEWKAYFLGFLYADGCVTKNYHVCLALKSDDLEILEKLKSNIYGDCNRPIIFSTSKRKNENGETIQSTKTARLYITNKKIGLDLIKLGCLQKKSLCLKFPKKDQVDEKLIRHFIRGYFDGDGHIGKFNKQKTFSLVGTYDFLKEIKHIFNSIGIESKMSKHFGKSNVFYIKVTNIKTIKKLFDFLYKDSTISMKRKSDMFLSISEEIGNFSSTHKYISFEKFTNKWKVNVRKKLLGRFKTENESLLVRNNYLWDLSKPE